LNGEAREGNQETGIREAAVLMSLHSVKMEQTDNIVDTINPPFPLNNQITV